MEYADIDQYDGSGLRIISGDYFYNDIIGKILSSNLLGEGNFKKDLKNT